ARGLREEPPGGAARADEGRHRPRAVARVRSPLRAAQPAGARWRDLEQPPQPGAGARWRQHPDGRGAGHARTDDRQPAGGLRRDRLSGAAGLSTGRDPFRLGTARVPTMVPLRILPIPLHMIRATVLAALLLA